MVANPVWHLHDPPSFPRRAGIQLKKSFIDWIPVFTGKTIPGTVPRVSVAKAGNDFCFSISP